MLSNNNQAAIRRISSRSMKHNRARNCFAILAVVLTTFMFTTVFGIGYSMYENMNIMMLREQGTKASIVLENPTKEQISSVKNAKDLCAAGLRIKVSRVDRKDDAKLSLVCFDKTEFEDNFLPAVSDLSGTYPEKENEIMLSKAALENLGIRHPKIGNKIMLNPEGIQTEFKLSGWFTDYNYLSEGLQGFVSEAYAKEQGKDVQKDGTLSISSKPGKQVQLLKELEQSVPLSNGQKFVSSFDVREENWSNELIISIAVGIIGFIIIFSGYLLIYNVMYISVTKDIRYYGMLKTIGTSPSQIKKIVKRQAFLLAGIGIPIGIGVGTLVMFKAVPFALKMFNSGGGLESAMPSEISFHPLIYIATILFGMVTIMVSCRKPAKLASRVSPVEALKYNGQNVSKLKPHKSTDGGKLYKMAFRNVFREKKRAFLVFASLFMGTVAFLSTHTFIGSLKIDNYVDFYLPNDYTIYTESGTGENTAERDELTAQSRRLAEQISKLNGVTSVHANRSVEGEIKFDKKIFGRYIENETSNENERKEMIDYYEKNSYKAPIIGVSVEMMKQYNKKARQPIDTERFERGEICFIGYCLDEKQSDSMLGKTITIADFMSGNSLEIEIGSSPVQGDDNGINVGYYWRMGGAPSCILVSEQVIDRLSDHPSVDNIIVDCEKKAESYVTSKIKALVKTNPSVRMTEIKSETIKDFKTSMTSMNTLSGGISIVLILIGIINFVNVMLTGVFTRRQELAVMESVGMTKKQVWKMLMYEGAYYGVITFLLIMSLGNAVVWLMANLAQEIADYAVFCYPFVTMCLIAVVIMAICILVPAVIYKTISMDSVTERLRVGE